MDDTQRLDALDKHGLCLTGHDALGPDGWTRVWSCHYQDRHVVAPSLREAIDAAVLDIEAGSTAH